MGALVAFGKLLISRPVLAAALLLVLTNAYTYHRLTSVKHDRDMCEADSRVTDEAIKALSLDYEDRLSKRKVITIHDVKKELVIRNVDRNITMKECRETANTIDAIRSRGLN